MLFSLLTFSLQSLARKVWKDYFPVVDAIVFIIDSFDRDRFGESKEELDVCLRPRLSPLLYVYVC